MNIDKISPNQLVKQSNKLNYLGYTLSPLSFDILFLLLAQIKEEDIDFKSFKFKVRDMEHRFGKRIDIRSMSQIKKELLKPQLEIQYGDEEITCGWCSSFSYNKVDLTVELEISGKLKEYLLGLTRQKGSYVLSNYKETLKLKSSYAKRLYLVFKQYQYKNTTGFLRISLDDLRLRLGIDYDLYPKYSNFKNKILSVALKQINLYTDIDVTFTEFKKGRSVSSFKFDISKNVNNKYSIENPIDDWLKS